MAKINIKTNGEDMTYKQKTVAGIEDRIEKYTEKEPNYHKMFSVIYCPFCKLYNMCYGCFMRNGQEECSGTYALSINWHGDSDTGALSLARAKWHKANLPYIKRIPAKYFTPSGWRNFDNFMPDGWRNRILGENEEMKM